ncbi:MAG: phage tail tape measure protein [Citrobacter sp.]
MASRLSTEILINLAGNLQAKARQYGANMSEFASRHQRAMSVVKATTEAAGRGLDMLGNRYTGMIAGFAGGSMLREFSQLDRRMTRIGIAAGKTREQMSEMLSGMQDAAIKFRVDDSEVVSAVEKVGTVTGDVDFGNKNREVIAASIAASGSNGESIGGLFSQLRKYGIDNEKDTLLAMDVLNKLGKEGSYELKDLAEKAVPALSLNAAAGAKGVKGIKDVGVLLESAIDATGNRDTAATLVENFIREIQNPKIAKALKAKGVNTRDKNGNLRSLPELLQAIAEGSARGGKKSSKGQFGELMEVGFTQTSLDLVAGASSQQGADNLKRYMSVVADGKSIHEDAAYAAKDFTSAMQSLGTTWKKFSNEQLAKPVQELADAINSVDQKTVQNWLEIGKNIAIATAWIVAARKAFKIGKGAWDILSPGKGKGLPKGVTDVFGSGVMPVYVVNMGAGGLGGASGTDLPDGRNRPNRPGGRPGPGQMPGGFSPLFLATTIPFLSEDPGLSDGQKNDMVKWAQERAKGQSLWERVTDFFTSASENPAITDPRPWAAQQPASTYPMVPPSLQGEIRVVVEGDARVKSVRMDQPGVRLSAQAGVSSVEQD